MRRVVLCVGWLLLFAISDHSAACAAETVGARGEPECVTIEGAAAFSPKQVKDALFGDFDVFLAAGPAKLLDDYLRMIERRLQAGYRQAGFPAVIVSALLDAKADKIIVKLSEGPRYMAGDIRVSGAKTVPVAQLIDRLVKPQPPEDATLKTFVQSDGKTEPAWVDRDGKDVKLSDPMWRAGKPAPFLHEPETDSWLHESIAKALANLGYFFPKFSVDVVPDTATEKASLMIDISDEGAKCMNDVRITGNKLNSREKILKYLAIQPGATLTGDELMRIRRLLWRSGRFIKFDVTPTEPAAPGEKGELRIDMVELRGAPPMSQPFSREEAILQKCRDWLANPDRWDGDLCLQGDDKSTGSAAYILSPGHGALLQIKHRESPSSKWLEYAAIVSPAVSGVYDLSNGRNLSIAVSKIPMVGSFALKLDDDANEKKKTESRGKFMFGFGVNSDEFDPKVPLHLSVAADPVFFVDLAHAHDAKCAIHDGILTVTSSQDISRIDAGSGRLLDLTFVDSVEDGPKAGSKTGRTGGKSAAGQPDSSSRISFVPGEFQRRSKAILAATAGHRNSYRAARPLSSALAFLCEDDWFWQRLGLKGDPKARHVLAKLLDHGVCEPMDDLLRDFIADAEHQDFTIPLDRSERSNAEMAGIAVWAWQFSRQLLPSSSWPNVLGRATILSMAGQGTEAGGDWQRLLASDDYGPIYSLVMGSLTSQSPELANMLRWKGLGHLAVQDVRKEYPLLLDRRYKIGKCVRRFAAMLRDLDDDEVRSLSTLLPDGPATAFRQWATRWRQDRKQSADVALRELLDSLWQAGLREQVAAAMKPAPAESAAAKGSEGHTPPPSYTPPPSHASPTEMIAGLTEAIRVNPDSAALYAARAKQHEALDETSEAIADLSKAIGLAPKNSGWFLDRARAYGKTGQWAKAIADCSEAIRLDATVSAAYSIRGRAYAEMGDWDKAIADCTEAIRLQSHDAETFRTRARAYRAKTEWDKALADSAKAGELDTQSAASQTNAGSSQGGVKEAKRPQQKPQ